MAAWPRAGVQKELGMVFQGRCGGEQHLESIGCYGLNPGGSQSIEKSDSVGGGSTAQWAREGSCTTWAQGIYQTPKRRYPQRRAEAQSLIQATSALRCDLGCA